MELPFRFDAQLVQLKSSVVIMESLMTEAEDVIRESIKSFNNSLLEVHTIDYDEDRQPDEYYSYKNFASYSPEDVVETYTKTLPSAMRRSVFLTIYSMLEYHTSEFCIRRIDLIKFPLELNELHGQGMGRCNNFLKKVIGMKESENLIMLTRVAKLRNYCIHNNGVIDEEKRKGIMPLIKASGNTLYFNDRDIIFDEGSIGFIIDRIKIFFNNIENAVLAYDKKQHQYF